MPMIKMHHEKPPEEVLLKRLGDTSKIEVFNNQVLIAVYVRPVMTASGLELPRSVVDEDEHQSKIGLVIAMGGGACEDASGKWFRGIKRKVGIGDWIIFRPTDGWPITVNKTMCRMLDDINVRGRVQHPDDIY